MNDDEWMFSPRDACEIETPILSVSLAAIVKIQINSWNILREENTFATLVSIPKTKIFTSNEAGKWVNYGQKNLQNRKLANNLSRLEMMGKFSTGLLDVKFFDKIDLL